MGEHSYNTWVAADLQDDASTSHANDPWSRQEEAAAHTDASEGHESDGTDADDDDEEGGEESDE